MSKQTLDKIHFSSQTKTHTHSCLFIYIVKKKLVMQENKAVTRKNLPCEPYEPAWKVKFQKPPPGSNAHLGSSARSKTRRMLQQRVWPLCLKHRKLSCQIGKDSSSNVDSQECISLLTSCRTFLLTSG